MMPLNLADKNTPLIIRKIGGGPELRKHLEDLGFVVGGTVSIVSTMGNGNLIVNAKEARIAISLEMATKIMV